MTNQIKLESLSVFFPCFNEEKNIKPLVGDFLKILPQCAKKFEILIINDGSTDNTRKIAEKVAANHKEISVINHPKNIGYGAAIQSGISHSQYDWLFFTDGDRQFDISQLTDFIPHTKDFEAIIGYRKKRADGQMRVINARLFKMYVDIIFRLHVKDIDCAFKLLKTKRVQKFSYISSGAMISTEILYRLKKQHLPFKQLPVTHLPRKYGQPTGNNLKVVIRAGIETIKLYYYLKIISPTS